MDPSRSSSRSIRLAIGVIAFLGLLLGPAVALAQGQLQGAAVSVPASVWQQVQVDLNGPDLVGKDGPLVKVGSDLALLYRQQQSLSTQGVVALTAAIPYLRVADGSVVIDAVASGDARALLADLEALGLEGGAVFGRYVSGRLPIGAIADAATLPSLQLARPAAATTNAGLTTSQGDAAMKADDARTLFSVDGTGITIGTLSDSYDCLGGAAGDVTSNDLPAGVNVLQDEVGCGSGTDEGRAMMQLIHDVAPGSSQAFHTAFGGIADFAQGILDLEAAGADVIVDDVIYFAEPMFQDGDIAQAVDTVVGLGVPYFSSAGNNARQSYESAFRASSVTTLGTLSGYVFHDFDPGAGEDVCQAITVPGNSSITFSFQWDEPFFSVSGAPGSTNDLDIFIFNNTSCTGAPISAGNSDNLNGDPVEIISITNNGGTPAPAAVAIGKFTASGGPDPTLIKYVLFSGNSLTFDEFGTLSATSFGHANAESAEAVGAAFYQDTPEFGTDPPLLESFSSAGGVPILFDTAGTRLTTPVTRQKPEITAPDGGNTTFFGQDAEPDGFPNFFGTSAAAPHAAAVAALMLELEPGLTPAQVYDTLETTAIDMLTPGFDFDSGYGLIQADTALANAPGAVPVISFTQTSFSVSEAGGSITISVRRSGDVSGAVSVDYATSNGTATDGSDYTGTSGTLSWGAGDNSNKSFTVTVLDDSIDEPDETVNLTLSNPTGGATLGAPNATLTITDNDAPTITFATGANPPGATVTANAGDEEEVIQATISLSAGADPVTVQKLWVSSTASGTNANLQDISSVRVYSDDNGNGRVDAGETMLASGSFGSGTTRTAELDLVAAGNAFTLSGGESKTVLVTYEVASPLPGAALPALLLAPLGLLFLARRRARRLLIAMLLVLVALVLAGCPFPGGGSLTRTYSSSLSGRDILSTTIPVDQGLPLTGSTLSVTPPSSP